MALIKSEAASAGPGALLVRFAEQAAPWVLAFRVFLFFFQSWAASSSKPLWFDEIFTYYQAQQTSWAQFTSGMAADGNPPLYALAVKLCFALGHPSVFLTRLPALLAFSGAGVLLYLLLKRWSGSVAALLGALLFFDTNGAAYYATEGRPYAFVLFWTAGAILAWQYASGDKERGRIPGRVGVAVCIGGAILSHHLAIFSVGLPLLAAEGWRSLRRRHFDWPLIGAAVAGLTPLLYTFRLAASTRAALLQHLPKSLNKQSLPNTPLRDVRNLLGTPYTRLAIVLFVLLVVIALLRRRLPSLPARWTPEGVAAMTGCVATVWIVAFVMMHSANYYAGFRYGIGCVVGLVGLLVLLLSYLELQTNAVLGLLLLLTAVHATSLHRFKQQPDPLNACTQALPQQPIVYLQGLAYPQAWLATDAATRSRVVYPYDLEYARNQGYGVPEIALIVQDPRQPMGLVPYAQFLRQTRDFIAVSTNIADQEYLLDHLRSDGVTFTPIATPKGCSTEGRSVMQAHVPDRP